MSHNDTIVAQATPPGRGGVGILRISGQKAREVAEAVLGKLPKPRYADYLPFKDTDGTALDQGIALWFPGPNSFTGEDVLELQGHGGPVILDLLLKRILTLPGLRIARPGEFSERAFLNDKLDLAQAEAIADLIDASSEQAARSALNSLQGAFSARVNHLVEALTHLRIYVEAAIDFPDEEIDFLSDGKIEAQLNDVMSDLDAASGQPAARRDESGHCRASKCREIEPAECSGGSRSRNCDRHCRHHSRRTAGTYSYRRYAAAYHRHRGLTRCQRRSGAHRYRARLAGDRAG